MGVSICRIWMNGLMYWFRPVFQELFCLHGLEHICSFGCSAWKSHGQFYCVPLDLCLLIDSIVGGPPKSVPIGIDPALADSKFNYYFASGRILLSWLEKASTSL